METIEIDELFNMDYGDVCDLPTIESGWTADLKIKEWDNGHGYKVWIERTSTADGQPYDYQLEIELTDRGRWYTAAIVDPDSGQALDLSSVAETEPNPYGVAA